MNLSTKYVLNLIRERIESQNEKSLERDILLRLHWELAASALVGEKPMRPEIIKQRATKETVWDAADAQQEYSKAIFAWEDRAMDALPSYGRKLPPEVTA